MRYVDMYIRDKDAAVQKIGTITEDGTFEGFKGFAKLVAQIKKNGVQFGEKVYTAKDGKKFIEVLPLVFSGSRLWATKVKRGTIEKAQDLEKLIQRQAEDDDLGPPLEDDDPFWEVDEAYLDELASRVEAGIKNSAKEEAEGG